MKAELVTVAREKAAQAQSTYTATVGDLNGQYAMNQITTADYATKVADAFAPVSMAQDAVLGLGSVLDNTLSAQTEAPAYLDDERMRYKAGSILNDFRTLVRPTWGSPYYRYNQNPLYDLDVPKNGVNINDFLKWNQIVTGALSWSSLGIPAFANGGISNGPSIFGEAGPEAAVPLPDGRRIPVQISGSADNRDLIAEINALREEIRTMMNALLKVSQAGFTRVANATEQTAGATRGIENKTKLQAAA
jgi:hypothetical protein